MLCFPSTTELPICAWELPSLNCSPWLRTLCRSSGDLWCWMLFSKKQMLTRLLHLNHGKKANKCWTVPSPPTVPVELLRPADPTVVVLGSRCVTCSLLNSSGLKKSLRNDISMLVHATNRSDGLRVTPGLYVNQEIIEMWMCEPLSLCSRCRHPPDDVALRAGACVRVHSLHETDGPVPLPRALLWRGLYTGCLPSPPIWEEPDPADQHGPREWPAQEGTGHSPRLQHRQLWHLKYETWPSSHTNKNTHWPFSGWLRERCNKATGDKEAETYKTQIRPMKNISHSPPGKDQCGGFWKNVSSSRWFTRPEISRKSCPRCGYEKYVSLCFSWATLAFELTGGSVRSVFLDRQVNFQ